MHQPIFGGTIKMIGNGANPLTTSLHFIALGAASIVLIDNRL